MPRPKGILLLLLAVACVRALIYAFINPAFGSPDERAHFDYVAYLARGATGDPGAEGHQPSPYYLLMVPVYWLTAGQVPAVQLIFIRLANVPFLLGMVAFTWLAARRMFPDKPFATITATALVALQPQLAFVAGSANNDNAANLIGAVLTYLAVALLSEGASVSISLAMLAAIAASLFTKGQLMPVTIVSSAILVGMAVRWASATRLKIPFVFASAGVLVALALLAANPRTGLLARAQSMLVVVSNWQETVSTALSMGPGVFAYQFFTFWAAFAGEVVRPPAFYYAIPGGLVALAAAGYVRAIARPSGSGRRPGTRPVLLRIALAAAMVGVWLLIYLTYLRYNSPSFTAAFWSLPAASGRYLFAALSPLALLVAEGWSMLVPKRHEGSFVIGIVALLALFDILSMAALVDYQRWPA